jgi:peptide/nickel transport system permease protein
MHPPPLGTSGYVTACVIEEAIGLANTGLHARSLRIYMQNAVDRDWAAVFAAIPDNKAKGEGKDALAVVGNWICVADVTEEDGTNKGQGRARLNHRPARDSSAGRIRADRADLHAKVTQRATQVILATSLISVSMILASGLSFLGLGVKPPEPEWGLMLNTLRSAIYVQPWRLIGGE